MEEWRNIEGYEGLYQVSNDLTNLSKDIDIKCNYIDIKRYHKIFANFL